MRFNVSCLLIAFLFGSCYRCPKTVYCGLAYDFSFVGYRLSDLDTIILKAYRTDNGSLFASSIIPDTTPLNWSGPGDTLYGKPLTDALNSLRTFRFDSSYVAYNWEIYLPRMHRTFYVHDISISGNFQQTFDNCKASHSPTPSAVTPSCVQDFTSYHVDGMQYSHKHQEGKSDWFIYLVR